MSTTDEQIVKMRLNKLVPMIIGIVLATNAVSLTVQRVANLEDREDYNTNADKRRIKNSEKRILLLQEIEHKSLKIEILEKELNYCKSK